MDIYLDNFALYIMASSFKIPEALPYSINNNGACERGTDDAWNGPDSVGNSHQDGGVLRSHVQVIHTKPGPGEPAQAQGQREEGGGGSSSHDEGS